MFRTFLDLVAPQFSEDEWQRLRQEYDKALNLPRRKQKLDMPFLDRMRRKADYFFKLDARRENIGLALFSAFWIGISLYFHSIHWRVGLTLATVSIGAPFVWIIVRYLAGRPNTLEKVNEHFEVRDFVEATVSLYVKNLESIAKVRRATRSKPQ